MNDLPLSVVTGSYGYTGKYITRRLLARGERVLTLTGHPDSPNEFGDRVKAIPFQFQEPGAMAESLRGATTLYNTYWVRFARGPESHSRAVANTQALIRAARLAGIGRIVHISITNPALDSPLPYFRGKAVLEEYIRQSGMGYVILRPTVLFGGEDILINNLAFFLRRLPVFAIPGSGRYHLQPIYVDDLARLAVEAGGATQNQVTDAVGPEIFSFEQLVHTIAQHIPNPARIIHVPATAALVLIKMMGAILGDVVLTRDELRGLTADLLVSRMAPTGPTRLSSWLQDHAHAVGIRYASELRRHYI